MDSLQTEHERAVGDKFIAQFNRLHKTAYAFERRGDPAPDLIYRDGDSRVGLEIVTCYYNSNDTKLRWQNARNHPDAPAHWSGVNFDQAPVANLNAHVGAKCEEAYGPDCLLVVYIIPTLTTYEDMKRLIPDIKVPVGHQFAGIYLVGDFGTSTDSRVNHAVWRLV